MIKVFISNLAVKFKLFARRKLKDVGKLLVDVARGVVHHVIPGKLLDKFVQMRLFVPENFFQVVKHQNSFRVVHRSRRDGDFARNVGGDEAIDTVR